MDFLEEINMLGDEIKQLVPKILLKIRQKSSKFDRVLDDKDKKFENYFLNTAKNRFESEYKDYVQKEIFLREVKMSESNDVIIIENSVKMERLDEDSSISIIFNEEEIVSDEQQTIDGYNGQHPVKTENNDKHSEINQSNVDQTPIGMQESKSIGESMKERLIDCNPNQSGMKSNGIIDKSCQIVQKSPSIANYQLNHSKNNEVNGSNGTKTPSTNGIVKNLDKISSQNIGLKSNGNQSSNNLKDIMFYCSHCAFNESDPEPYNNLKALLKHCSNSHMKKPVPTFSFHVGIQHRCIICPVPNTISKSFRRSLHHFQGKHQGKQFFVTDQRNDKKCSICEFQNGDLSEHFQLNHPFVTNAFVFDPIRLNKTELDELIQMQKCDKCFEVFRSKQEANNHVCRTSNDGTKFAEKRMTILCGECNEESNDEIEFVRHFKGHEFTNVATLGNSYYKTKYLYGNGLIIHKYNLLDKNDNEKERIEKIIQELNMKTMRSTNMANKQGGSKNSMLVPVDNESNAEVSSTNEKIMKNELRLQQKELNKLLIFGTFDRFLSDDLLRKYFIEMCGRMSQHIEWDDIKSIRQTSKGITVEFKSTAIKNQILNKVEPNGYWMPQSKVKIFPKLTEYYQLLSKKARKMIEKKQIYRERIRQHGLAIQVHPNNNVVQFVNSIEELAKFEIQHKNVKRGSEQSPRTPPKRPRNHF